MPAPNTSAAAVAETLKAGRTFILTSHARPDGDAIGSQLALAFALDALGKTVRLIDKDASPAPYRVFPGMDRIELMSSVPADVTADAVVFLECSDPARPEVAGFERFPAVNIDHHLGNTMYGAVNWFDASAAACAEMVASVIDALGVAWTREIASHLYLGISTDTGGLRYGPISARTFELCRRITETGVDTPALSRQIFDSFKLGRVKLIGAMLNAMELFHDNRLAVLYFDDVVLAKCGADFDDTEGLVNVPLGARETCAVALFKRQSGDMFRVSLRSKGDVDVRAVSEIWSGGGHKNAAGCTMFGDYLTVKRQIVEAIGRVLPAVADHTPSPPLGRISPA